MFFFSFGSFAQTAGEQMLRGHVPPAIARFHLQPLRNLPATNQLSLAIGLPLRNETALDDLLRQISDPASPNYRHYLTPEQFTEKFGPTEQDYESVINFVKTNGLTVTATYPNHTLVDVRGNVAAIEKVFHVTLRVYRHPREARDFFAPDSEPSVDLSVPISHVSGLDNFTIPHPAIIKKNFLNPSLAGVLPASGSGPSGLYMGNDFRAAYAPGVTLNGAGQTVGLLEFDGYYSNDIAAYESEAGLPNVTLTNILVDSYSGSADGDNSEVALDIEMVMSMAPGISKIAIYEEQNGGNAVDILNRIADYTNDFSANNFPAQISSSWLIGDDPNFDTAYKQMAMQGQSFFQASGDDGAYYSGIAQSVDDTNITLVGGTTLSTTGPGGSYSSETAWNWYITNPPYTNSTGGGTNLNGVPIPSWQTGINMTTNQGSMILRNVPDVALTADGIFIVADNGEWESVGGTSAAAPLWAGFTALVNQRAVNLGKPTVGFLNPAIYAIGKSANYTANFHDITTGNDTNSVVGNNYFAVPGYDLCTGWGTPNGQNLINTLVPPDTLVIVPAVGFNATGATGGPFNPNSQIFLLTNSSASSLTWSLINTSSWLNASPAGGTLAANGTNNVAINLNAAANNLGAGIYSANIKFTNANTHVVQSLQFSLQAIEPLVITPSAGFTVNGVAGGPFDFTTQNFSLSNIATASLSWQIANTSSWLNVSPTSGTLAGGAFATITASLNSIASNLVAGIYPATIFFTNQTSGIVQNRQFILSIGQSIVENGGFETGDFTGWTLNGDSYPDNFVTNSISYNIGTFRHPTNITINPYLGNFDALMGEPASQAYLSQTMPTFAGQSYLLSLWMDSPNSETPNEFSVAWNEGILFDQSNLPRLGWTNLQFIVIANSNSATLQIGGRDAPTYLGLDDVSVVPIPAAAFHTATLTATNNLKLVWNALTGLVYQVQFKTNLLQPDWLVLKSITATNTPITFVDTNPITASPQKFYRLQLLP